MSNLFEFDFSTFTIVNWIDLIISLALIYWIFRQLKGTIARNVIIGYFLIVLAHYLVVLIGFKGLGMLLNEFIRWGVLGIIIIFQQEIRHFLDLIGKSATFQNNQYLKKIFSHLKKANNQATTNNIIEAIKALATAHTGALIVIQKNQELKKFMETGDEIDAAISKRLIISVFNKNSPLMDGAMIIQNERIAAVRCSLPIAESGTISPNLGFRHRAAIGMSEHSDAAILVVSEENGEIALITPNNIERNLTINTLEEKLNHYLES
jgi:diadenylate cyclase